MARKSSGYGYRTDPVTGQQGSFHAGDDFAAPNGTPIYTNTPMTVTRVVPASASGGYGNMVEARDAQGNTYKFAHLNNMNVEKGQQINPGDQIGNVGNTGKSTGNHLHYEVHDANGKLVDPEKTNPATGKPYTDSAGFERGKTLTNSTATPDKNVKPNSNTTPNKGTTDNSKTESKDDKQKRQKDENIKKQPSAKANNGPRPGPDEVGILENPLNKL
jgi:murein DD-endopeptidase MepM/ murein hydrolase activator NlpD